MPNPSDWLKVRREGLYCIPGDFYIDPKLPVATAIITHAHADHAISGNKHVLATPETLALLATRYGVDFAHSTQPLTYRTKIRHKNIAIYLLPAGHILGSAQIVMEYQGQRIIFSGDYKRRYDPTCPPFEPEPCDVFITEATFGLPIFKHPPIINELNKLIDSMNQHPESCHVLGVYTLGKCQRIIAELRQQGYEDIIFVHTAKLKLCEIYQQYGIELGKLALINSLSDYSVLKGRIVLISPSAIHERWLQKFPNPILGLATGWMQVRARAKQQGIELPLIISDHADWYELTATIQEIKPREIWVTHGQEEALIYYAEQNGFPCCALDIFRDEMEAES